MAEVQEAHSPKIGLLTKQDILQMIPQYHIRSIFIRQHLDREIVIGTIGDRGGGKSGSDAVIGIIEFLLSGKKVWSNMVIKCDIEIDDITAREYGLNSGGVAHYESLPIEKDALLKLDESYRGGCLVIEEINIQYSNVRRFMSNTNVDSNEVWQQLRKFKTSLIYNVIDEMFIDSQLRSLTDVFLMTYDTAFDLDSLHEKKNTGVDFKWTIWPMSGYLAGEQGKYLRTHKALPSVFFHFQPWRGVYDTYKHQEKGTYSLSKREREKALKAEITMESSDDIENGVNEYQWLIDNVRKLKQSKMEYLEAHQLWQVLEIVENGKTPKQMGSIVPSFGINKHHQSTNGKWIYKIESFSLPTNKN